MRRRNVCKPLVMRDKEAEALVQEIQRLSEWYVEEQKTTLARLEVKQNEYRVLPAVIEGKAVKRPGAGEERLARPEHDGMDVESIRRK